MTIRLGINIDHIATLRNARGGNHPDVLRALEPCKMAGAESITIHLREDRRHIRDADVAAIIRANMLPVNLEMAATEEMLNIALAYKPHAVCIVPEKRAELTTEGGLDVIAELPRLTEMLAILNAAEIRTSLFVDADEKQIEASKKARARCIEIHTGKYAKHFPNAGVQLSAIKTAVQKAHGFGLEVHAGHGLNYDNTPFIAAIPHVKELNIGHFLMGEALFVGLENAIHTMKQIIAKSEAIS
jgi:pyridoxine 5-phosphate synthase